MHNSARPGRLFSCGLWTDVYSDLMPNFAMFKAFNMVSVLSSVSITISSKALSPRSLY